MMAQKLALDRDLKAISRLEKAASRAGRGGLNLGLGFVFLLIVLGFVAVQAGSLEPARFAQFADLDLTKALSGVMRL